MRQSGPRHGGRGDDDVGGISSLCLRGEGVVLSSHSLMGACPSPRPSPRERREGEEERCHHPKTKRGPAFPPAPRCRRPLACPSGRRARRGGGRQCSTNRQGTWNPAFQRSLGVRWPVTGTGAVPKSRVPASMSLRSLCALRRSGIAVRSSIDTIPEGSFHSITSRRSCRPKAFSSVAAVATSSRPCPKAPPLRCNPLHPVRRRALRPWLSVRPVARRHRPLPFRLSPPARGQGCHWTPVRSVRAKPMRTSPSRFPGVASPSRSMRFPEGTCMVQAVTNI